MSVFRYIDPPDVFIVVLYSKAIFPSKGFASFWPFLLRSSVCSIVFLSEGGFFILCLQKATPPGEDHLSSEFRGWLSCCVYNSPNTIFRAPLRSSLHLAFSSKKYFSTFDRSLSPAVMCFCLNIRLVSLLWVLFLTISSFSLDWSILFLSWDAVSSNRFRCYLSK